MAQSKYREKHAEYVRQLEEDRKRYFELKKYTNQLEKTIKDHEQTILDQKQTIETLMEELNTAAKNYCLLENSLNTSNTDYTLLELKVLGSTGHGGPQAKRTGRQERDVQHKKAGRALSIYRPPALDKLLT